MLYEVITDQVIQISYRNPYNYKEEGYKEKIFSRFNMIKQEVAKIKGVKGVAAGAFNFGNGANSSSSFMYNNANIQGQNMGIDFEMLPMMNIKIKEGRNLSPQYASDTINSMLVNETAVITSYSIHYTKLYEFLLLFALNHKLSQ